MRLIIAIEIILVSWTIGAFGQTPCEEGKTVTISEQGDSIISYVEKMPYLQQGFEPYANWIKTNMDKRLITKNKREAKRTVYVSFVVSEDGSTSEFNIIKGVGEPYDSEALRLIMDNPGQWVAGQCGNRKVRTRMTMPVKF